MKLFRWLFLALLTTLPASCRLSFFSEMAAKTGDTLYQDDFHDPSSGWAHSSGSMGAMDYYNGTYRIQVNIPNYDLWAVSGKTFGDVRVEADMARFAGPEENRFGLICRYRDSQNFYFFIISSDGYYAIGKVSRGLRTLLGQEMMTFNTAIRPGITPNHLRADCVGQKLTLYVNSQRIAMTQDPEFTGGDTGLLAGVFDMAGVDVIFENFKVIKP